MPHARPVITGTDNGIQATMTPHNTGAGSGAHQGKSEGDFIGVTEVTSCKEQIRLEGSRTFPNLPDWQAR